MAPPASVLLCTDGTYPCYRGGVSVWCDQLIRQLADVEFHSFAITYSPSDGPVFERPRNVISETIVPLWGTEDPGPPAASLLDLIVRKLRTTPERIQEEFVPTFREVLACIFERRDPEILAHALLRLHHYFRVADFALTMSSEESWEGFLQEAGQRSSRMTLDEATKCLKWLQRYLAVCATPVTKTDIVHASMAGLAGIPGVLQKLQQGTGFLLTEHGIYLRELYLSLAQMRESAACRQFLFRWFEAVVKMNYHYADQVTSLCEFNRRWQIRMGAPSDSIRIIPNGTDPQLFTPPSTPIRRERPVVLTMARIYRLKGIDHLLPAIRLVLDRLPHVRFRILGEVGDRDYARSCTEMADRLGIQQNIEWGQTSEPQLAYRDADLFCLPSISEAMPYSILEAMFSACPVVATDVGGVKEMLGGTGLVVPPRDPVSLARAILSMLDGEQAASFREDLAAKALLRARTHYNVERCSNLFRESYGYLRQASAAPVLAIR